jgi:hypothetical protein
MADHSGDTGMWVGAGIAASSAGALLKMYGPKLVKFIVKVIIMLKREETKTVPQIPQAPQCPPSGHRSTSAATLEVVSNTAIANERLDKLSDEVDEVRDDVRDLKRDVKALRGDLVTVFNGIRESIDRGNELAKKRLESDEKLNAMLDKIGDGLKQRKL